MQKAHSGSPYWLQSNQKEIKKTVHRTFKETIEGPAGWLVVLFCFVVLFTCKMYFYLPLVVLIQDIMRISRLSSGSESKFQATRFPNMTFSAAAASWRNALSSVVCDAIEWLLKGSAFVAMAPVLALVSMSHTGVSARGPSAPHVVDGQVVGFLSLIRWGLWLWWHSFQWFVRICAFFFRAMFRSHSPLLNSLKLVCHWIGNSEELSGN